MTSRESQAGRCLLVTDSGIQSEVLLHDISLSGLGFDLPYKFSLKLKVRQAVQFKCVWDQQMRLQGGNGFPGFRYNV